MVQLIRPVNKNGDIGVKESFIDLIANVDISCCGVSYDGKHLYENYPNAIAHCQNFSFYINKNAKMYSHSRSVMRSYKFIERGWKQIEMDDTAVARDQRIENLLSDKPAIDYISELPNGVYCVSWKEEQDDDLFPF